MKKITIVFAFTICFLNTGFLFSMPEPQKEKVFAHVSKNIAAVGDKIWFNANVINEDLKISSKILYAEIVNREGIPVQQSMHYLSNGKTSGIIEVPNDLESDHYLLRFYTRTSALSGIEGVFNQFVTIIHPYKPPKRAGNPTNNYIFNEALELSISTTVQDEGWQINQIPKELSGKSSWSLVISNPYLPKEVSGFIHGEIYLKKDANHLLIPEPYGHIVHGKILNSAIDTTETFYLSAHGKESFLSVAKPTLSGDLFFELSAMRNYNFLIIQSKDVEKPLDVSIQSPFFPFQFKNDFHFPDLVLDETQKDFILDLVTSAKVTQYFYTEEPNPFLPITIGFASDRTYLLDDYVRFEDIETTLREYVPEVLVRKQNRKFLFKVVDDARKSLFRENPLVVLDAMPVFDIDALAKFDPKEIMKLDIMTREFSFHKDQYAGVLSFQSFQNDFGKFPLPPNALYLEYQKLENIRYPQTPHINPRIGEANFPDFRNILYWNQVTGNTEKIAFYSSSIGGEFQFSIAVEQEDGSFKYFRSPGLMVD